MERVDINVGLTAGGWVRNAPCCIEFSGRPLIFSESLKAHPDWTRTLCSQKYASASSGAFKSEKTCIIVPCVFLGLNE
jgi:hypothetical protein